MAARKKEREKAHEMGEKKYSEWHKEDQVKLAERKKAKAAKKQAEAQKLEVMKVGGPHSARKPALSFCDPNLRAGFEAPLESSSQPRRRRHAPSSSQRSETTRPPVLPLGRTLSNRCARKDLAYCRTLDFDSVWVLMGTNRRSRGVGWNIPARIWCEMAKRSA